jgi:flagellar secretion chaperone FliS
MTCVDTISNVNNVRGIKMFIGQQALKQYKSIESNVQAEYASSYHLTKMLFTGALKSLTLTSTHMKNKNFEAKASELSRSYNIIMGLHDCLDFEQGGELADNLGALYEYMAKNLVASGFTNDSAMVEHITDLMRDISDAWDGIPLENRMK